MRAKAIIIRDRRLSGAVRSIVWVVMFTIIAYAILILLLWLGTANSIDTILGVPPLIIMWGCIGGITAVIFRHRSTMEKRWPFDFRWLWIILRPLLGAIMGSFIYLAIVSGLLVFGLPNPSDSGASRPQLFWALAFIGGVSDRLWDILIEAALGPYGINQENKVSISEQDAKPDLTDETSIRS